MDVPSETTADAAKLAQDDVKKIAEQSGKIEIDSTMKPMRYFVSGKEMYRMGMIYLSEGDNYRAFTLFMRFLTLFVEKLPCHPAYATVDDVEKSKIRPLLVEASEKARAAKLKLIAELTEVHLKKMQADKLEAKRRADEEEKRQKDAAAKLAALSNPSKRDLPFALPAPAAPHSKPANFSSTPFTEPAKTKPSETQPLRTLVVSSRIAAQFLRNAEANTKQNRETCGILCGKLVRNEFHITHVVIPKQHGSSDTCDTLDEHEIFTILEDYDLITLGWIHTHPSQTAFLSSVDLHTQYGYQCLLPEAIAVVCSPRYNQVGYFSLTATTGMRTIGACRQHGFHEHKTQSGELFENAPFVRVTDNPDVRFIDLRSLPH